MITPATLIALSLFSTPAAAPAMATLPAAVAAEPNFGSIVADRSPAMVGVKFIASIEFRGQTQEVEGEAMALMIDAKGLLVVSGSEVGQRKGMSATLKEIKILIGDDTEGVPAKLIGRDSELDLAWLRIEKPADKGYSAIDAAKSATPKLGDTLVGVDRMSKYFDHAPVAFTTTVGGITKKPRTLLIPSGGMVLGVGLPIFNAGGEFVGMSVIQSANADSEDGMNSRSQDRMSYFDRGLKILPAAEIASATARAIEAEKSGKGVGMDEPKKEGDGEKKDEAKPADEKKPEAPKDEPKKEPVKKD
ncbi:MAG: hypothetical protein QM783_07665 [Phycisphaerales bacterium]